MTNFLTLATGTAEAAPGGMNWMVMLMLFAGMWFLLIAPQRKKQKKHRQMLETLATGDTVVTSGGIYGVISNVKEDRFVVKISDTTKIEIGKGFVQGKVEAKADK